MCPDELGEKSRSASIGELSVGSRSEWVAAMTPPSRRLEA